MQITLRDSNLEQHTWYTSNISYNVTVNVPGEYWANISGIIVY